VPSLSSGSKSKAVARRRISAGEVVAVQPWGAVSSRSPGLRSQNVVSSVSVSAGR